jgi:hypothetical protein
MVHARHFLTCAHVVNAALGRSDITARSAPEPGDRVHIEFSELSTRDQGKALPCKVVAWDPPSGSSADFTGDIAGLELSDVEDLPGESAAAPLIHYTSLPSPADGRYAIEAFGYPRSRPRGTFATGYFRRVFGPGLMQFETSSDMRPQVGFSGTPIIFRDSRTESTDYVVGMLSYSSRSSRDSYCVSTARLIRLWPQLRPSLVRSTLVCANMSRVRGFEVGPTFSTDGLRTIRDRYSLPDGLPLPSSRCGRVCFSPVPVFASILIPGAACRSPASFTSRTRISRNIHFVLERCSRSEGSHHTTRQC